MDKKQYLLVAFLGLLLTTLTVSATSLAFGGKRGSLPEQKPAQQAIVANDYNAWQVAMTTQIADMRQRASDLEAKINQDTFNKLTQAHQLMQAGKKDEAKVIFDEIGMFGPDMGNGHMGDKGMGQGMGPRAEAPVNQ